MKTPHRLLGLVAVLALTAAALPGWAADEKVGPDEKEVKQVRDKAIAFLKSKQGKDGGWSTKFFGPGVTAVVVSGLSRNGVTSDDETMKKGLGYLTSKVQKDGGIHEGKMVNYMTSVGVMALAEANENGKFDSVLKGATKFLKKLQNDDVAENDVLFGSVGYNEKDKRADLSNTHMFVEALLKAGVPKDDPAVKRALQFVSRCQNFADKEKGNDQAWAAKAKDADKGGFVYRPDPDDKKHSTGEGGLRSAGAMTYAGLKTFLYAGVDRKDPRVQNAVAWISRNYTLDENPGMKQSGLYYYYHTFGKAMDALGQDTIKVAGEDSERDWRKDLFEALKKRQQKDGSFVNDVKDAFGEGDPSLATAFALLSLSYTTKK